MKNRYKRISLLSGLILLILFLTNLWYFFTREWESSYYPVSYATLYYPLDVPTIKKWNIIQRDQIQLDIACANEIQKWIILTNGESPQTVFGMNPVFRIDTTFGQLHTYTLSPIPVGTFKDIEISVTFYPKEFYKAHGMKRNDVYVVRANVPCGKFKQFSLQDWVDDYNYVGEEALAQIDQILNEQIGIRDSDSTFTKMEKLARFLRKKLINARGVPKNDERWMNPWLLYNEMVNGTGKGWCTQHAQLWVFWANRAGIPTRFVFGSRTQDNTINYTGHAFAESFIREQNRWAFVDLSHSHIYIKDKMGQVLNTAELFLLNQHNAFDSTFARIYKDWEWKNLPVAAGQDTVVTVPFSLCNQVVRNEFTAHSIMKYRRPPNVEDVRSIYTGFFKDKTFLLGNLERYLFKPQLAYSFYPTEGKRTYFVRQLLFFSMLFMFLFCLTAIVGNRFTNK